MNEVVVDSLYNYPKYYELVFGSDWQAEFRFMLDCFDKHADRRKLSRAFEPACGTGRLLCRLAQHGVKVEGLDLNEKAIDYCNARLVKSGHKATTWVGDMTDFRLKKPVDLAFNMINSFRHLRNEAQAQAHLQCVADALAPGGLYLLGLHLTPTRGVPSSEERWSARRGQLAVLSHLQTLNLDRRKRAEHLRMTFDVYTPLRNFRLTEELTFRTYTAAHMQSLFSTTPELSVEAVYDFRYDVNDPIEIEPETEDVVYVLKKAK